MSKLYMIHFDRPINPDRPCIHYTGIATKGLRRRLEDHARGRGARLTQVALERGIGWQVVATWEGTRRDERRFKQRKNAPRYCPICNGQAARQWKESGVITDRRGRQRNIATLPKWAQEAITDLIAERERLSKLVAELQPKPKEQAA